MFAWRVKRLFLSRRYLIQSVVGGRRLFAADIVKPYFSIINAVESDVLLGLQIALQSNNSSTTYYSRDCHSSTLTKTEFLKLVQTGLRGLTVNLVTGYHKFLLRIQMYTIENELSELTSSLCISLIHDCSQFHPISPLKLMASFIPKLECSSQSLRLRLVTENTRGTGTVCLGHRACKWPLGRDGLNKAWRLFSLQECHERFVLVLKKYCSTANVT